MRSAIKTILSLVALASANRFRVISYRAHLQRLNARLGLSRVREAFILHHGLTVCAGPCRAMLYVRQAGSTIVPKLIGSYEMELDPWTREFASEGYETIMDVGCTEGYYVVVRDSARTNDSANMTVLECDVSRSNETDLFPAEVSSIEFSLAAPAVAPRKKTVWVCVVSIDPLVKTGRLRPPNLVNIDVKGTEIDVLGAMANTNQHFILMILCKLDWLGVLFLNAALEYRMTQLHSGASPDVPVRWRVLVIPTAVAREQNPDRLELGAEEWR